MFNGADGSMICSTCIEQGYNLLVEHGIVEGGKKSSKKSAFKPLTREDIIRPDRIKHFLDDYVIGQDAAKRYMSVACLLYTSPSPRDS